VHKPDAALIFIAGAAGLLFAFVFFGTKATTTMPRNFILIVARPSHIDPFAIWTQLHTHGIL
jgi:hypothetical protein